MSESRQRESSSGSEEVSLVKSAKDRECPFCHQAFTSSSLGRHLDLFIRPHNPKQPDGVHKVDEIRKIRGRITRRQPKGIGRAKTNGHDSPEPYLVQEMRRSQSVHKAVSSIEARDTSSRYVNAMDWRSTGVINDIEPRRPELASEYPSRMGELPPEYPSRKGEPPPEYPSRKGSPSLEEQAEYGKAAELALRDLIDSINASQATSRPIFHDIDVLSLSFPGLCLALLPAPSSLFSITPFSDDRSWDLKPPTEVQKNALGRALTKKLEQRQDKRVFDHLDAAYNKWIELSTEHRQEAWTLEVLRTWTRVKKENDELQSQLSAAQQRIAHLESEYEYLSRCQLPREKLISLPTTHATPPMNNVELNAQELIQKWRENVRAVARPKKMRRTEMALSQQPTTHNLSSSMIMTGSVHGIGGPMNRSEDGSPPAVEYPRRVTEYG